MQKKKPSLRDAIILPKSHISRSRIGTPTQVYLIPRIRVLEKETKSGEKRQALVEGLAPGDGSNTQSPDRILCGSRPEPVHLNSKGLRSLLLKSRGRLGF